MKVKLLLATNEIYAGPTAVAIKSVIDNSNKKNQYHIFIMHNGLSELILEKYHAMLCDNVNIETINIADRIGEVALMGHGHLSSETLFRLYIPELFPNEQKILYMDGDMIALDDISAIYSIELGENVIAAAPDTGIYDTVKHYESFMDSNPNENFNAGLLLINIPLFMELKVKDKCIDLLKKDAERDVRKLTYMDQDALNIVCKGNVKLLDMAWNVQPLIRDRDMEKTFVSRESRSIYEKAMSNPHLIHFVGRQKPWMYPGMLFADKFWEYEKKLNFHDEIIETYESEMKVLGRRYPYWNIKKGSDVVVYGAGYQGVGLIERLNRSRYAKVVMVADSDDKKEGVHSISEIKDISYDQIIIAVENETAVSSIYEMLSDEGVLKEKIVWLFERDCPWK